MTRRLLDTAPEHALEGTVHYINPDRADRDHIEVRPEADGTLMIRCVYGRIVVVPHVANTVSIRVEKP